MVFTYYRIYVIASKQTRSLKLGMKQIEMSSVGEAGGSGEYRECFVLRMHRGGAGRESGGSGSCATTSSATVPVCPPVSSQAHRSNQSSLQYHHSISQEKIVVPKTSTTSCHGSYGINASRSISENLSAATIEHNLSTYEKVCVHSSISAHTNFDNNSINTAQDNGNKFRNHKANWSVGRRLAKLAKGKYEHFPTVNYSNDLNSLPTRKKGMNQ